MLVPSAWLAWQWRAMPHLGYYHDDALYWVGAKSLAEGQTYRILSLPGQPFQTKYPPLFPLFLSLAWRWNPSFPANLPLAMLSVWCVFPAYLALVWLLFRKYRLKPLEQCVLLAAAALNPVAALLSISLMPELLFTALLLGTFALIGRGRPWAILGGICAALAYLAKPAALPLLFTVPLVFVLQKQYRNAICFAGAMLPAVAAWQWWVFRHVSSGSDLVALYYTNYLGFQKYNAPLTDLPLVVWHNLDAYLMGVGKLLTFDVALFESKHLERVVAAAAIAGVIRLARRTGEWQYPAAAAGFSAMLLVWHYSPDQRFVFPLYPLLLAGLWTELKNVAGTLRTAWEKRTSVDRVAAVLVGAVLAGFVGFVFSASALGLFGFLPRLMQAYADDLEIRRPAYRWLAAYTPLSANVFAYDDPAVYLYAGRHACNLPVPPKLFYHDDQAGIDRLVDRVPEFAREQNLQYFFLTQADFYRDLHESRARRLERAVAQIADPALYHSDSVSIYAVPSGGRATSARVRIKTEGPP